MKEGYGRVVPDLNRVRTDKLRLRGVQVLITVWEHDTVGPIVLQEAVRDPVLLGRVSCALTAAEHNVAELTITSRCIVVRIDMRETWTDVDLERMQRRFQVAACEAIRCVNCPRVGCHGCQGEQANTSEPVQS